MPLLRETLLRQQSNKLGPPSRVFSPPSSTHNSTNTSTSTSTSTSSSVQETWRLCVHSLERGEDTAAAAGGGGGGEKLSLGGEYPSLCSTVSLVQFVSATSDSSSNDGGGGGRCCVLCADMATGQLISAHYERIRSNEGSSWQCFNSQRVQLFTPEARVACSLLPPLLPPAHASSQPLCTPKAASGTVWTIWVNSM